MNPRFKATLEALAREALAPDPLLDWDLLARLASAAEDCTNPPPTEHESAILRPCVRAGNALLHRLTIGARWFLAEQAQAWFEPEDPAWAAALAFICAHAREPEILWRCMDRDALIRESTAWIRGVGATPEELDAALTQIIKGDQPESDLPAKGATRPRAPITGAALEQLASEYGITPENAVWKRPEAEMAILVQELAARKDRESKGAPDPDSPRIRRLIAYQQAEAALRQAILARRAKSPLGQPQVKQPMRPGHQVRRQSPGQPGEQPGGQGGQKKQRGQAHTAQDELHQSRHGEPGKDHHRLGGGLAGSDSHTHGPPIKDTPK
jgi:hypothetical protein